MFIERHIELFNYYPRRAGRTMLLRCQQEHFESWNELKNLNKEIDELKRKIHRDPFARLKLKQLEAKLKNLTRGK